MTWGARGNHGYGHAYFVAANGAEGVVAKIAKIAKTAGRLGGHAENEREGLGGEGGGRDMS